MRVVCINNKPLTGRKSKPEVFVDEGNCPKLELGKEYEVLTTIKDSGGNEHYNVGLKSSLDNITSFETGEVLPESNKIHWCHPSRFKILN